MSAMKAKVYFVLLITIFNKCFGVSLGNDQEQNDSISSLDIYYVEDSSLHLTWNLLNPTGAVRGYSLTWNDGPKDKQKHVSEAEALVEYPSNIACYDALTVTVTPLDDDNIPIGTKATKKFVWQDVVTDVILTPEGNMIFASWVTNCPSHEVTDIVVIWEEVNHNHELSCQFPGTARNTSTPTKCHPENQLQACQDYYVYIEPLDSSSSYVGIAGRQKSYALEEGTGSKSVEMIELTETSSRSATLLWKGPNPECPGSNYAVAYTETRLGDGQIHKGQANVARWSKWAHQNTNGPITANVHPSDNGKVMGHVDNLRPYSEYEFCVAAGAAVANLMCKTVRTLEEVPDRPVDLTLTSAMKAANSIDVTWQEASNMNGNIVNYIVRWYLDSHFIGSHNTTKPSYKIVNVQPCVNYTITVAAVNRAGEGEEGRTFGTLDEGCLESNSHLSSTRSKETNKEPDEISRWSTSLTLGVVLLGILLTLILLLIRRMILQRKGHRPDERSPSEDVAAHSVNATQPLQNEGDFRGGINDIWDDKEDEQRNCLSQLFAVNE